MITTFTSVPANQDFPLITVCSHYLADKPSPPYNVRIVSMCTKEYADIEWAPGSDNNDQVIGYAVYFNTSHDEAGKFHEATRINGTSLRNTARIPLRPWTSYTFHVTSENNVGTSDRSEFTHSDCTTPPARPHRNPHRVCTESRDPDSLVIIWEVRMTNWCFLQITGSFLLNEF